MPGYTVSWRLSEEIGLRSQVGRGEEEPLWYYLQEFLVSVKRYCSRYECKKVLCF